MLNNVNLPVLFFKKVNLPITNRVMNRLLILCWCVLLFTACNKVEDPAIINTDQVTIDREIIEKYLADNNLTNVAKKVKNVSGRPDTIDVYYIIEKPSTVSTLYSPSSRVTLSYTGRKLQAEKLFAESGDINPSFVLGDVLRGWQFGIPMVNKGGIIRLIFASRYGYGPYAQPVLGLSPNSILDFRIEVSDVTN